jgi:hypothetical protein
MASYVEESKFARENEKEKLTHNEEVLKPQVQYKKRSKPLRNT